MHQQQPWFCTHSPQVPCCSPRTQKFEAISHQECKGRSSCVTSECAIALMRRVEPENFTGSFLSRNMHPRSEDGRRTDDGGERERSSEQVGLSSGKLPKKSRGALFPLLFTKVHNSERHFTITLPEIKVCAWLRKISSCFCLTFLPGPARVLLKTNLWIFVIYLMNKYYSQDGMHPECESASKEETNIFPLAQCPSPSSSYIYPAF